MSVLETPSRPWDEGKQTDNDSADSENKSGKEIWKPPWLLFQERRGQDNKMVKNSIKELNSQSSTNSVDKPRMQV